MPSFNKKLILSRVHMLCKYSTVEENDTKFAQINKCHTGAVAFGNSKANSL